MTPRLLPYGDAAEYLGVSVRTLEDWVHDGLIAHVKTTRGRAGRTMFDLVDLDRWIDAHKVPAGDPVRKALEEVGR